MYTSGENRKKIREDIINAIETGKIKIGDIAYCTEITGYTFIVELPEDRTIEQYYKYKM